MKSNIIFIVLFIWSFNTLSQTGTSELVDDLVKDKNERLANYIPMNNGQYLYAMYVIPPNQILEKLNAFQDSYEEEIGKETDPSKKTLKEQDIYYHKLNALSWYIGSYGMDSIGMAKMYKLVIDKKLDPNFDEIMAEARKDAVVKRLSPEEKSKLENMVMSDADLNNGALFKRSSAYRTWIEKYITKLIYTKYKAETDALDYYGEDIVRLKAVNNEISNSFIKEYFNYRLTGSLIKLAKDSSAIEEAYKNFIDLVSNPNYKKEIKTIYDNYIFISSDSKAPDFSYNDVNDVKVTLKELQGKYVYIDVWATWCGPCKAEIPFLKKVEKQFHDKNIQFVSISVDKERDREKWKTMVKEMSLGGIQLIADNDFSSAFIKRFNINSIPRFILLDPDGKIVDANAPRPSNEKLITLFDKLKI